MNFYRIFNIIYSANAVLSILPMSLIVGISGLNLVSLQMKKSDKLYFPNKWINQNSFSEQIDESSKSKSIAITPAGLKGFYSLGVCTFLKENYNLTDYLFTGASAGSWNSLFLSFKHDPKSFVDLLFNIDYKSANTMLDIEILLKNNILNKYSDKDFDLDSIYLGTTIIEGNKIKNMIYNKFDDLEDALECCIASSHIPFVTGGFFKRYKGKITFDGGFCSFFNICPYYSKIQPSLIIDPDLFSGNTKDSSILNSSFYPYDIRTHSIKRIGNSQSDYIDICDILRGSFDSLDIRNINLIKKMYEEGYNNCIKNKKFLDEIFNQNR